MEWEEEVAMYEKQGMAWTGAMATRMKMLLISEQCPRTIANLDRGKIDVRKLTRLSTGGKNIFKRKLPSVYEDSAVALIVDHSGSMGTGGDRSSKAYIAHSLVCSMALTLESLRVPFEVIGLRSETDGNCGGPGVRTAPAVIEQMKLFEEPYRLARQYFVWGTGPSENNELPIFQYAAKRLWGRRETKKIMMIFSDGQVAFGHGDLNKLTEVACKELIDRLIDKAGYKVFGFGIEDTSIGRYCRHWMHVDNVCSNPAGFGTKLYAAMQKALT
jgi:cobalamin biosynthesis protein CobT